MAKNMTDTIDSLRAKAVGRCRERIEQAAQRAKGLLKNGQQEEQGGKKPCNEEQYGVTSLLKRKHGL